MHLKNQQHVMWINLNQLNMSVLKYLSKFNNLRMRCNPKLNPKETFTSLIDIMPNDMLSYLPRPQYKGLL